MFQLQAGHVCFTKRKRVARLVPFQRKFWVMFEQLVSQSWSLCFVKASGLLCQMKTNQLGLLFRGRRNWNRMNLLAPFVGLILKESPFLADLRLIQLSDLHIELSGTSLHRMNRSWIAMVKKICFLIQEFLSFLSLENMNHTLCFLCLWIAFLPALLLL